MKRLHLNIIESIILLFLAGTLLFQMCKTTNQAMPSIGVEVEFTGEYSLDGIEWQPLEKNTKLSSFDGDIILRGKFTEQIPMMVNFYLNHIGVTISVRGEQVFEAGQWNDDVPEMMCGSYWSGWICEDITEEDEIEICLHNSHEYGNAGAYNEFLDSLYLGGENVLQDYLEQKSMPYWIVGIFMIVVSVALLGMALGYFTQKLSSAGFLWSIGLLLLFMGGYILLDTIDIEFHSKLIVFNTCVRQVCIMFASLELVNCIRKTLTGKRRKIAGCLVAVLGTVNGILLICSIAEIVAIYDTSPYWAIAQGLVSMVLLVLCILEYSKSAKKDKVWFVSYIALLLAVMLELVNARMNFWISGIVVKVIFILLFVFHIVRVVRLVAMNQMDSLRAKKLEEELKSSRIVLAMSQIQPHFIYNALGAIRSLCVEDSQTAVEAIDRFSGYLRGSLEMLDKEQCISFQKEMEFVDNYLYLEQRRFENKIKIEKNITSEDFMLPPMSVQPIVENAVRHGIRGKRTIGTITIKSFENEKEYIVTVTDDGVGFDVSEQKNDGKVHVGLKNVEKRLQLMCKGSIEVESILGQGTTVTIRIPKNEIKDRRSK